MKLKDTGLTAEELKDIVKKYNGRNLMQDMILSAERAEGMYLYDEKRGRLTSTFMVELP